MRNGNKSFTKKDWKDMGCSYPTYEEWKLS